MLVSHGASPQALPCAIVPAQYTAAQAIPADDPLLTQPAPGSVLAGSTVTFEWTPGKGVAEYWLYIGSTQGGLEMIDSGSLGQNLFVTVSGLPLNGGSAHVRLWFRRGTLWFHGDYLYTLPLLTTARNPEIVSPSPRSTLLRKQVAFEWTERKDVLDYTLLIGTSTGAGDLFDSGSLGTSKSVTVSDLPIDGRRLFVRLVFRRAAGVEFSDYGYQAVRVVPEIVNAPAGSVLGPTVTLKWRSTIQQVFEYWLYLGSSQGAPDLFDSGTLRTDLSATIAGLPTDGRELWVRLWFRRERNGLWEFTDFRYFAESAADAPQITDPAPGAVLDGAEVTFSWTRGAGALHYWLYVGSSAGGFDLHSQGYAATEASVSGLPTNGQPVFVRLWYLTTGGWQFTDYQYTAAQAKLR